MTIVLIILWLIVVSAAVGFGLWQKDTESGRGGRLSIEDLTTEIIIDSINNKFFNSSAETDKNFADWILDSGNKICLEDGRYLRVNNSDAESISKNNKVVGDYLQKNGFIENMNNKREEQYYENDARIGYEIGNLKCSITWSLNDNFYSIGCASLKEQDGVNHNNFYNLVNIENDKRALVCVKKQNNEYATGVVGFWRDGATWYVKKADGEWKLLARTQEALPCSLSEQLPEGFYTYNSCYEGK